MLRTLPRLVEYLSQDPRIRSAARLGEAFSCDPIDILNSDENEWMIRMAAAMALARDHKEAEQKRAR